MLRRVLSPNHQIANAQQSSRTSTLSKDFQFYRTQSKFASLIEQLLFKTQTFLFFFHKFSSILTSGDDDVVDFLNSENTFSYLVLVW